MTSLPYTYRNTYERYVNLLGTVGLDFFEESRGCLVKRNIKLLIFNILFLPFAAIQFGLMLKINAENFLEGALVIPIVVMFALGELFAAKLVCDNPILMHYKTASGNANSESR